MKLFRTLRGQNKETEKGIGLSLAGLVMVAVVPLLVFGSGVAWMMVEQKKAAVAEELASTARALRVAVDRELLSQFTAMEILAPNISLDAANLADFHNRANRAAKTNREWLNVALIDPRTHHIVVSSPSVPLPSPTSLSPRHVDQVVQTGKPLIVGAFASSKITGGPIILLLSPVMQGNEVRYVLGVAMNPQTISDVFVEQKLPPTWTGAVVDNNMTLAGRSRDPERYVGVRATPSLANRIAASESGMFSALNQEGATVHTVFSRSPVTGWSVVIGVPAAEVEGPTRRILFQLAAAGGLLMVLALVLTSFVGRVIVRRRSAYEKAIKESESRFRLLADAAPVFIWISDKNNEMTWFNSTLLSFRGRSLEQELKSGWLEGLHPDDLSCFEQFKQHAEQHEPFSMEFRFKRHDGQYCWIFDSAIPRFDEAGDFLGYIGSGVDISERKQAELEREQFYTFFNISSDLMCIANITGNYIKMNPAWEQTFGYTYQELSSRPFIDFIHPDDLQNTHAVINKNLLLGVPVYSFENRHRCKDGTYKWLSWTSNPCPEQGITYAIARDITEHKQLEQEREQFYTFFNTTSDIMCIADPNGAFMKTNPACKEILGYSEAELVAKPFIDFVHPDDKQETLDEMERQQASGYSLAFTNRYMCKDGSQRWLSWRAVYNKDENRTYATARDITRRMKAEQEKETLAQQLHQAQKMESLGVLAGGIAHDFNNILAVIMSYSSLGQQRPEMAAGFMPEIEKASERAAALCRQMLAYAGKTQFVESRINMTALLDDTLGMLKSSLPQNATITPCLTGDLPSIEGDASQLRQVVVSLIMNASEAIGEAQGEIRVALTKTTISDEQQENDYTGKDIASGTYLCLEVSDTGCGMDDETKSRIFEPFFTTKFVGRGLGMSAVLGVINSHNGALQLSSQPRQGTTFKLYFPVQKSECTSEASLKNVPAEWAGSGTILLVEDEPQLITVARNLLETLGFSVIEALNGAEALEQYRRNAADIRLVLTDIGMPLMNGYQLIRELKKLNPNLPIIVSSGFGDTIVTTRIAPGDIVGLISKPYNFDQLREVLKGVMEGAHSPQA